jgi:hypothetical protein
MGSNVLTLAVRSTATELVPGKAQSDLQLARVALAGARDADLQRRLQEQRLADRERHYHKEVWTKDPHGGPHRKVPPLRPRCPQPHILTGCWILSGCLSTARLRLSLASISTCCQPWLEHGRAVQHRRRVRPAAGAARRAEAQAGAGLRAPAHRGDHKLCRQPHDSGAACTLLSGQSHLPGLWC